MTDYTKAFLAASDKNANLSKEVKEGPGLEMIPEGISERDFETIKRVIQDEEIMKRIVRYTLLSRDE